MRVRDGCAELLQRQSAPDQAVADDKRRRSPDAESIGEDGVPLNQRIWGGIFHGAREPLGVEADGAGGARDVIEVEGARGPRRRPLYGPDDAEPASVGAAPIPRAFQRDPRVRDGCAELLQRQGAPVHAIADGESRRSPDAESIGEDGVPLDQRIQGGVLHVAHEPLGIETDGAGDGEDVIEVEGASTRSSAR